MGGQLCTSAGNPEVCFVQYANYLVHFVHVSAYFLTRKDPCQTQTRIG